MFRGIKKSVNSRRQIWHLLQFTSHKKADARYGNEKL